MRTSREKINESGCYYHLMNRVAGIKDEYPLGETEREKGLRIVTMLSEYYLLEFISMCWMGNHFHLVLYAPGPNELPNHTVVASRHNAFYSSEDRSMINIIEPDDEIRCTVIAEKMRNISHFMQNFQQRFTTYYNRTHNRRGRFWADRFKSTIVQGEDALLTVIKYIDLNPVRVKLVKDPAEYRHCSWGWYCGSGKHMFASTFLKHLRTAIGWEITKEWSEEQLLAEYRSEIARTITYEQSDNSEKIEAAMKNARKSESMPVKYLRRMRHISDGGIIGSKLFVQETASLFREHQRVMKKKFSHGKTNDGIDLYCYKYLRLNI